MNLQPDRQLTATAASGDASGLSDRNKLENDLRRREADLSVAQTLANLGGWEWDLATGAIRWSPELIGMVMPPAPPQTFDDVALLLGAEHTRRLQEAVQHAIVTGEPVDLETPVARPDGTVRRFHSRARIVRDLDGKPLRVLGMSQDITARKESEAALRLEQDRYRAVLNQIEDVVFSLDRDGRFTSISEAFERATGLRVADWIGRPFSDLVDEESLDAAQRRFAGRLANQESGRAEYVVRTPEGRLTVEVVNSPFFSDGVLAGVVGVARNVTTRKTDDHQAERERRLSSLGQLAGAAAHEFNNVLMSILPFAEVLRRAFKDDPRVINATDHITTAVRRGRQISQQILRLSRPANPTLAPLDVGEWLRAFSLDAAASLGSRFKLEVVNDCPGVLVVADRLFIDQVATNLVTNAREAMAAGGTISIRVARSEGAQVAISVTDQGEGIDPDQLDHVFEPLFTTRHGASGLGLTVAHQAMSLQNGRLEVESRLGEGSTFTMVFREADPPLRPEVVDALDQAVRVLLVEDEEAIATGTALLLESEGMNVMIARRGAEVFPVMEESHVDAVVLDVRLPDADGLELFERLHARWPSVPVIFSTGHLDALNIAGMRERQLPTVTKPYDVADLIALIRRTLAEAKSC